jgi:hypothetical protein
MLKKIVVLVICVLFVLATTIAMQPAEFRIARSITASAPPAVLFAQVNDLHAFQVWNPYAKKDPAMKQTYEGPRAGVGSSYAWAGNQEVGTGRMTIVESRPNELVRLKLEFLAPFRATNVAEFTFDPTGDNTVVTWSMSGTNDLMGKAIGLVMDMDKMVGGDFEKGLADLKALAEARAAR